MTGLFRVAAGRFGGATGGGGPSAPPSRDLQSRVAALELDVEKLFMIAESFWVILKDRHGYTDEQLVEMIREIDLQSGRLDGRRRKTPNRACPNCGRPLISKHPVCLYCGAEVPRDPFEG